VAKDRTGSKRLALFAVTNTLFKIYFKVNTLQLCGKLINVVEGPGSSILQDLRSFPVSDVVMYKYYIGRLKMFEDRYTEARCVFSPLFCLAFSFALHAHQVRLCVFSSCHEFHLHTVKISFSDADAISMLCIIVHVGSA
jgi:hypothetical protein